MIPSSNNRGRIGTAMKGKLKVLFLVIGAILGANLLMSEEEPIIQSIPAPKSGLEAPGSEILKICAAWNMKNNEDGIDQVVRGAKELGFNAFAWTATTNDKCFISKCAELGIRPFKVLEPLRKRPGARMQRISDHEMNASGASGQKDEYYQYGGEPVSGTIEVLDRDLVCPGDDGIIANAEKDILKAKDAGYTGICWDFIGYRNYQSCDCEECKKKLDAFLSADSSHDMNAFYRMQILSLYSKLYGLSKKLAPEMLVICHCHPVFLPDPFLEHKVMVDYCGMTVSWFFRPHWGLDKVRKYTEETVSDRNSFNNSIGMPMIGIYNSGTMSSHAKDSKRISEEIKIVAKSGARAVMICELGDILSNPETSRAVKDSLEQFRERK